MDELKPCPFCGGTDLRRVEVGVDERVGCATCLAFGPQGDSVFHGTRTPYAKADFEWNRRVPTPKGGKIRFTADAKHTVSGRD